MRIVYVAKHDSGGNDDEGAIHHALSLLGHDVQRVREVYGEKAPRIKADFLLFHHWSDIATIAKFKYPKVFWYFDRVDDPDPSLARRNAARIAWMAMMTPRIDLGFCTDGDWVAQDKTGKLVWLTQGADERVIGRGEAKCPTCSGPVPMIDILFTGIGKGGGARRESFVAEMKERYGERFKHVERGIHGRALADLIASAKIVVAPDAPCSDRYWSNRVYNVLGFGGFLLHPWSAGLTKQYDGNRDLSIYYDRNDLNIKIEYALSHDGMCREITACGLRATQEKHLYRHRCAELVKTVRERLGI